MSNLTIGDYFKYASLATASYVRMGNFTLDGETFAQRAADAELGGGRLPAALGASLFVSTATNPDPWSVLSYYGGDIPAGQDPIAAADKSGFGATLFERNGEKVLAIRGTEPKEEGFVDLASADLGQIGILGLALTQVVSMANYVMRLRAATNVMVAQMKVEATLEEPTSGVYLVAAGITIGTPVYIKLSPTTSASGLGELIQTGVAVKLTGHSLGGHLAVMAARLFPDIFDANVVVFNSAGYDPSTANAIGLFQSLAVVPGLTFATTQLLKSRIANEIGEAANLLGTQANSLSTEALNKINQVLRPGSGIVQGAPNVISVRSEDLAPGDDLSVVASKYTGADKYGAPIDLPTEANNHVIEPFMDALALLAAIEPIKGSGFTTSSLIRVLEASSNNMAGSYEGFAEGLYRLFQKGEKFLTESGAREGTSLPTSNESSIAGVGKGTIGQRNAFHDAVLRIHNAIKAAPGPLTLVSLADMPLAELKIRAQAANGLAYRYALKELSPFAVLGPDALYAQHNLSGGQDGALDLFDAATGNGQITTSYIADRAEMLALKNVRNTGDLSIVPDLAGTPRDYVDYRIAAVVRNGNPVETIAKDTVRVGGGVSRRGLTQIAFGSDKDDPLQGFGNADRLYGGAGDDSFNGLGGNDYLEGGVGADKLNGGFGDDTLVGGADDDILRGGVGDDIYRFQRDGGHDIVADTREGAGQQQLGKLFFDSEQVVGIAESTEAGGKVFTLAGAGGSTFTLTYTGDALGSTGGILNLFRNGDPSVVTVQDFSSGDFGIVLGDVSPIAKTDLNGTSDSDNSFSTQEGHGSTLIADSPNQKVFGLAGNDRIIVAQAGAEAYGGSGDDYITNDVGDQWLYGEEGNDILIASGGNDTLDGGIGNDALQGGEDSDVLIGGDGNDAIDGGAGSDAISGGDGHDFILGGGSLFPVIGQGELDSPTANPFGVLYSGDVAGLQNMAGLLFVEGDGANSIDAGAGNDTVLGGEAADFIEGGTDNDLLLGFAGQDTIYGDVGDDHIQGDITEGSFTLGGQPVYAAPQFHAADYLDGGDGDDTIVGDGGADELIGGAGNDTLIGDNGSLDEQYHGADYLDGGTGNDILFGNGKDDTLFGGAGNDTLEGDSSEVAADKHGNDYLDGEAGDDTLKGDGGADTLFGGDGADQLFGDTDDTPLANQGDDYLDGEAGDDYLRGYAGNDTLYGGDGADQMLGDAGIDYLDGEGGNDLMSGGEGNDTLIGGLGLDDLQGDAGDDSLDGGEGNDLLFGGEGDDTLSGGEGNDQLAGGAGADKLTGGAGDDTFFADAGADTITGGEGVDQGYGGEGNDAIYGEAGNDSFDGEAGNDRMVGGEGNDVLLGGAGDDVIVGDAGDDQLGGGDGKDRLTGGEGVDLLVGDAGDDVIAGDAGNDELQGGADNDELAGGSGDDLLIGGTGLDVLAGEAGADELQGGDGSDSLVGGEGNDRLFGESGADSIHGGAGNDELIGGTGQDVLAGGEGFDLYYWNRGDGRDSIIDEGENRLVFGPGITLAEIKLAFGSLKLDLGGGDEVHIEGFNPDDPYISSGITEFEFTSTGTTISLADLLALGFDLDGTPGNDTIAGTALNDRINALEGNDVVFAKAGNDIISAGEGNDTVDAGADDDELDGGAGDDALSGGEGSDSLYGGEGADTLAGGTGDDFYIIDDELDTIVENADEGYDVIEASISYTIAENIEELSLTGEDDLTGTGNALDNYIAGNSGGNLLLGLEGDDQLDGNSGDDELDGGTGADVMFGGGGDDLFVVDSEDDVVIEEEDFYHREFVYNELEDSVSYGFLEYSGGYDVVESSVSFALDQWTEELVLTGSDAIDGVGNVEANYIEGNEADNALYGYRLNGEADVYPTGIPFLQQFSLARNAAEEMLADKANVATFRARYPWFLPQQVDLNPGEGDALFGWGGDDRLYGSLDDDWLVGGEGDDLLYGFAGADFMEGGEGDDTYVVSDYYEFSFGYLGGDSISYTDFEENEDELFENEDEGTDTVVSEIDFELAEHFENLTLVADTRAYDPDGLIARFTHGAPHVGVGNEQDNVLTGHDFGVELHGDDGNDTLIGGAGSDYLSGGGGGWADLMIGGGGDDTYIVTDEVDVVQEAAGAGIDSVEVDFTYTLGANVENLYLQTNVRIADRTIWQNRRWL